MKLFDFTADKDKLSSQITESIPANEEESINESLQALAKHVKEGTALCDSPFRHGSKAYIQTFQLAKKLRQAGSLPELDWESEEMLGTDIGESVKLKNGETVWLDIPYLIEDENEKGMIGEPDDYYDAEERIEAYNDLQDDYKATTWTTILKMVFVRHVVVTATWMAKKKFTMMKQTSTKKVQNVTVMVTLVVMKVK